MKIITISREFGSGGRELGKRLADTLGFDYYDREIITAIARAQGLDEDYVEKALDNRIWQRVPLSYRRSFGGMAMQVPQTGLLLEQKRVIEGIGKAGRDCVIVGRNADVLLADKKPFHIFVCADMETKIRRCVERAADGENLSRRQMEQNIRRVDKNRAKTRELITGMEWGKCAAYHLTVNTGGWDIRELVPAVAGFADCWFAKCGENARGGDTAC